MRSLFRIFSLSLICFLLIASSDAAVNMYGYGSGRSLATVQGGGVVTLTPGAYQSPEETFGLPVNSPSNTGYGNTTLYLWESGQFKSCQWHSFPGVTGTVVSINLKFNWGASVEAGVQTYEGEEGYSWADF